MLLELSISIFNMDYPLNRIYIRSEFLIHIGIVILSIEIDLHIQMISLSMLCMILIWHEY